LRFTARLKHFFDTLTSTLTSGTPASGNYQNHVLENNEKIFQEQIELFRLFFGNTKLSDEQRWEFIEDYFTGMSLEGLKEKYSCVVE
jgi:hypothetical protein